MEKGKISKNRAAIAKNMAYQKDKNFIEIDEYLFEDQVEEEVVVARPTETECDEEFKDEERAAWKPKLLSNAGLSFKLQTSDLNNRLPPINLRYPNIEPVYEDHETEND